MVGFPSPFGGDDEELFDEYDEFVPEHLPEPGPFLQSENVLTGRNHVRFHERTRELFEERTVYDMTFGYNLARLNLDTRHPDAGYRYAEERDGSCAEETDDSRARETDGLSVLRAEFTPTTPFCPQTQTLTVGSFRAWNGLSDRHDYDLVRVRAHRMHHQSEEINEQLASFERAYRETGDLSDVPDEAGELSGGHVPTAADGQFGESEDGLTAPRERDSATRSETGDGPESEPDAPF